MEINARFDKYVLGQFQHEYLPVLNVQKKKKKKKQKSGAKLQARRYCNTSGR